MSAKTVLLTGASGVFGEVLILGLLQANYRVIALTSKDESAQKLKSRLGNKGETSFFMPCDLTSESALNELVQKLEGEQIYPNSIIHGARSIKYLQATGGVVSKENFMGELDLAIFAPYSLTMKVANAANSRLESVVFISSMYGVVAPNPALYKDFEAESFINYGVAKAAQIHLAKELAVRLAKKKIRVNSVSFSGVEGKVSDEFKAKYAPMSPLGRMLKVEEIYAPVEFLLSTKASSVTGHNLAADGGWTAW